MLHDTVGGRKSETRRIYTKNMDEQVVEESVFWRTLESFEKERPVQKTKSAKHASKKPFSGPGSAFFGFLMFSSSFWPDSRPILTNLGRFWAIFLFWGVLARLFMLQKLHFSSTYGI